jgi:menaquinone-specific isochorismate synthase
MTQFDIKTFLENGAFVRNSDGQFYLWSGLVSGEALKPQENQIIVESSGVQCMDFFAQHLQTVGIGQCIRLSAAELLSAIDSAGSTAGKAQDFADDHFVKNDFAEPEKQSFEESFLEIQKQIQSNHLLKAVPIVFARSKKIPSIENRRQMLLSLLVKSDLKTSGLSAEQIYPFGFWCQSFGIIGATPEVLFYRQGEQIQTMALAGTLPKKSMAANSEELFIKERFLQDPKERHEHDLVVQDIVQRLKSLGEVKTEKTEVVSYPKLYHLRTWLSLNSKNHKISEEELTRTLHPTAALGCFPRQTSVGLNWFSKLPEQVNRGVFGAPIVFHFNSEKSLALVAIRNLLWDETGSRIGTGCGIVASSQMEKEWQELASKRDFVYDLLGIES